MIYISYLGVFSGNNFEDANTPKQIGTAFNAGYSCMVAVWRTNNRLYVGTPTSPIEVTERYLQGPRFFINAVNTDMQDWIAAQPRKLYPNYFYFPNPRKVSNVTTSGGQIITPGTVPVNNTSIIYLPENQDRGLFSTVKLKCYGVLSAYLSFIKRMRNEGEWY